MLAVFDDHVSGGLPFENCDVVTDFYERIFGRTEDPRVKELVIRRLWEMGAAHNRFYVRTQLLSLLSDHRDAGTVEIVDQVIANASPYERRFYNERANSFDLPQSIRVAIAGFQAGGHLENAGSCGPAPVSRPRLAGFGGLGWADSEMCRQVRLIWAPSCGHRRPARRGCVRV